MFVAMMDAVYSAIKAMGYDDLDIVVAESGWPSLGDPNQPMCTVENAVLYNKNMIKVVTSGEGTPLMPKRRFETYVFALFNENLKPGTAAERNWGLFRPDFSPVYDVGILSNIGKSTGSSPSPTRSPSTGSSPYPTRSPYTGSSPYPTRSPSTGASPSTESSPSPTTRPSTGSSPSPTTGKTWSEPKADASDKALQASKDYGCSQGAHCKPIQTGGSSFNPNNIRSHASLLIPLIMICFVYI
ncbi:hypothetical protein NC653_026068 [Populus alba x Populus x berolinensis]|uniref:glucan endo-1,3-beta-D-glucosidase n=1 Tax=Populus alba x Populus x berolinensis TaxID=444605 RepID=A0AAD6MCR5_9ROSI|nr:hypothetical protein NC653_026068 [Populus alba x Populus x berolinensis]